MSETQFANGKVQGGSSHFEENGKLPPKYKPHKLTGNFSGKWECHILPDWLLVWEQNDDELVLLFTNTGSHSDIF